MNTKPPDMVTWLYRHAEMDASQAAMCLERASSPLWAGQEADWLDCAHGWALCWLRAITSAEEERQRCSPE